MRRLRHTLSLVLLLTAAAVAPAAASTHTWTGNGDGVHWSDGANWSGGVPTSNEAGGTFVVFGTNTTSTQDIVGLFVENLHFTGGGNTINGSTTLGLQGNLFGLNSDTGTNVLASTLPLQINPNQLSVGVLAGDLSINGSIGGSGKVTFTGPGTLHLNGVNSYTGVTTVVSGSLLLGASAFTVVGNLTIGVGSGAVNSAIVQCQAADAIGHGTVVTIGSDGRFDLSAFATQIGGLGMTGGNVQTSGAILTLGANVSGTSDTAGNPASISGSVNLGSTTRTFTVVDGPGTFDLVITGAISGSGSASIDKMGTGTMVFAGTTANTFPGSTTVTQGTLRLAKSAGVNAVSGALAILGAVTQAANEQIGNVENVVISPSGTWNLENHDETVGPLIVASGTTSGAAIQTGTGRIILTAVLDLVPNGTGAVGATIAGTVDLGGSTRVIDVLDGGVDDDLTIEKIVGTGGVTKLDAGRLRLNGASTYSGTTVVLQGDLAIGAGGSIAGPVSVSGGRLLGAGSMGAITGASGIVTPGFSPAILTSTGALSLGAALSYNVELLGTTVGSAYDQLNVAGPVTLTNATLGIELGFVPPANTQFVIINSASGATTGTFNGLPENSTFAASGTIFRINYNAGTGNDVVLTAVDPGPTPTPTPTETPGPGGGGNVPVPTVPEWVAIGLGGLLLLVGVRRLRTA